LEHSIKYRINNLGRTGNRLFLYVYDRGKGTEQSITNSLAKIETQADSLQRLSGKWMDRLTRYVTTERPPGPLDYQLPQLIAVLGQLPQAITMKISQPQNGDPPQDLVEELITCYIAMYYYSALTNFWAAGCLPDIADFDDKNDFHQLTRRIIEGSCQDFQHMANILEKIETSRLERSPSYRLLEETRDLWRHHVRSVSDLWAQRAKQSS
jgi:hypothetical protein